MLCAGWALAAPYDASPDEAQHILRAVGVARGEITPRPEAAASGTGAYQHVPASLIRDNCWQFKADTSAACAVPPGGDKRLVKVGTRAGRYNPVYYATVGWPLALWPDWLGVTLARLISAALSAGFLASAAHAAVAWTRHRITAAGVLVAVTPITAHLSGSVNPSGLEIAAAVALFGALIPTLLQPGGRPSRAVAVQIGVAGATLATLRALGPLWVAAAFGVLLVPIARTRLTALARSRGLRMAVIATVVATAVGAIWTVTMRTTQLGPTNRPDHLTVTQTLRFEVMERVPGYLTEMIGVPSWLDTYLPGYVYTIWDIMLGGLLVPAFALGTRTDRWRLSAIVIGALGVAIVPESLAVNRYGFVGQGRYVLPLMVGLPMLAAWLLGHRNILDGARSDRLIRAVAVVVVPMQLVFLGYTMVRWQSGLDNSPTHLPLDPLKGSWHPVAGSVTALGVAVLGCTVLLAWVWRHTGRGAPDAAGLDDPQRAVSRAD